MTMNDLDLDALFAQWMHEDSLDDVWQRFENVGLIPRVVVHRVTCKRCGPVVTVIRVGGYTIAHHKAFKVGRAMNDANSHPVARRENTLDGERWWRARTENLTNAVRWPGRTIRVECRHLKGVDLPAGDLLAVCDAAEPGKPGRPTLL